jgi:hypothetical protein
VRFDIDHECIRVNTPAGSTIKVGYNGHVIEVPPGGSAKIALSTTPQR